MPARSRRPRRPRHTAHNDTANAKPTPPAAAQPTPAEPAAADADPQEHYPDGPGPTRRERRMAGKTPQPNSKVYPGRAPGFAPSPRQYAARRRG